MKAGMWGGKPRADNTTYQFSASTGAGAPERRPCHSQEEYGRRSYKPQPKAWQEKESYRRSSQARERARYPEDRYKGHLKDLATQRRQGSSQDRSYYRAITQIPTSEADKGSSSAKSQFRNGEKGIPLTDTTSILLVEALQLARDEASLNANAKRQAREDASLTPERIPAMQRLSLPSSQERIPMALRLGANASLAPRLDHVDSEMVEMQESAERVPAALRIGHLPAPQREREPGAPIAPLKRKPG
ncbi:hypothetical protein HID58_079062 [Brassica napus]|uniref:Uncharacterized protein n=1 Tax=Brassica napus TaxID=3708 RepID=A0ABQ7Y3R2_BRANA|nr:hypothetical protein HID58_079062 [Brassica napus]